MADKKSDAKRSVEEDRKRGAGTHTGGYRPQPKKEKPASKEENS